MSKILKMKEIQEIETDMLRVIDAACTKNNITYYLVFGNVLGAIRHEGPIPWDFDVDITVPLPEMDKFCQVMKKELEGTEYRILIPGDKSDRNNITTFPRVSLKNVNPRKLHIDVFPEIGISEDKKTQEEFTKELTKVKIKYRDKRIAYTVTGQWWKRLAKFTYLRLRTMFYNEDKLLAEFNELCQRYPYEESKYVTTPSGPYGTKNIMPKEYFGTPRRVKYLDMELPVPAMAEEYLRHYYNDYMKYPPQEEIDKMMSYKVKVED